MDLRGAIDHRQRADGAGGDALAAPGADGGVDDQAFAPHGDGERRAERHAQAARVAQLTVDDGHVREGDGGHGGDVTRVT
jgi:hypothetical protein